MYYICKHYQHIYLIYIYHHWLDYKRKILYICKKLLSCEKNCVF